MHLCQGNTHRRVSYAVSLSAAVVPLSDDAGVVPRRGRDDPGGRVTSVDSRRFVPRTDVLLADPRLADAERKLGRALVKAAVARAQDQARAGTITPDGVADAAVAALPARATTLTPVINATGVLLHTNLGRAPLSAAATDALFAAAGSTDVEYDLASGTRGRRGRGTLAALAAAVPAAEAVHVVNNNAAALVLAATALAAGREILISRGEMVEIGDGFRLPDLLESTGALLREVGTTNRTTIADYQAAAGPRTAFALKVHPSNFRIEGFTAQASVRELARALGPAVPVVADIGSGLLAPHPLLPDEPDAQTTLRDGAALVTASGDKLLGGPQAGLMLGRAWPGPAARPPSAGPRAASRQIDPGCPGGHPGRAARSGRAGAGRRPRGAGRAGRTDRGGPAHAGDRCPPGGHGRCRRRRGCSRCGAAERRREPAGRPGHGAAQR